MKLPFIGGPLDGQSVEIGNNLLDFIDVYEPVDGSLPEPFTLISPHNGLWSYSKATLVNDDHVYIAQRQPQAPQPTLYSLSWTRVGPFEIYNPTDEDQVIVASQSAVILPGDGYRVRLV